MESPKHECEYCGRQFRRSYNLKRHIEEIHNRHADDIVSSEPDVAVEESSAHEESDTVSNTHDFFQRCSQALCCSVTSRL